MAADTSHPSNPSAHTAGNALRRAVDIVALAGDHEATELAASMAAARDVRHDHLVAGLILVSLRLGQALDAAGGNTRAVLRDLDDLARHRGAED